MRVFVGQHKLGTVCIAPLDVILDPARALIVQPDLFFISKQRQEIITDHVWGAPDLVVEVMSPHPRIGKVRGAHRYFAQYGVRECWLIHQLTREFEVLRVERARRRGAADVPRRRAHRVERAARLRRLARTTRLLVIARRGT